MLSAWARQTFAALGNPGYRMLWIGTTLGFMTFSMGFLVRSIVAFDITGKNGSVGIVGFGMGIATVCVAPFGGVLADRLSKRKVLIVGQGAMVLVFLLTGVLVLMDQITIFWLAASTFVMGVMFSFIAPARQAWIGQLLDGPELVNGIALQQLGTTATNILGPLVATVLISIALIGTGGAFIILAAMMALVVGTIGKVPDPPPQPATRRSVLADLRLGLGHVASRPRLALLSCGFMAVVLTGFTFQVALPGFLAHELDRDSGDLGWLSTAAAFSGLLATLSVAGLAGGPHAWRIMIFGGATLAAGMLVLSFAGTLPAAMLGMVIAGGGTSCFQMLNNALVFQESDQEYFGRVVSLTMFAWGIQALALWPIGVLADHIGESALFLVLGLATAAVVAAIAIIYVVLSRFVPAPPRVPVRRTAAALAGDADTTPGG